MTEIFGHRITARLTGLRSDALTFVLEQTLQYTYPGPVHDLHQYLMVVPADCHGGQRLLEHGIEVSLPGADARWEIHCPLGNRRLLHHFPVVESTVEFRVRLLVERLVSHAVAPCDMRQSGLFLEYTELTAHDWQLRKTRSATFSARHLHGLELADAVMEWVFGAMTYSFGATAVHTPAAQALAWCRVCCQDYAHIMITLCRLCGLPSRYVSGHMLGEGRHPRLGGSDGS